MNNTAHKAMSTRCAASANDIASVTIPTSFQKLTPARPSLLSWRTKLTVAITASACMKIVQAIGIAPTANGIRVGIRGICVIVRPVALWFSSFSEEQWRELYNILQDYFRGKANYRLAHGVLRAGAAKNRAGFFVGGNLVEEIADLVEFLRGNHHILNFVSPFVMQDIVGNLHFAFISPIGAFG